MLADMLTEFASTNPILPINTVPGPPAIIIQGEVGKGHEEIAVRYQEFCL
jgi:hypothetical protein